MLKSGTTERVAFDNFYRLVDDNTGRILGTFITKIEAELWQASLGSLANCTCQEGLGFWFEQTPYFIDEIVDLDLVKHRAEQALAKLTMDEREVVERYYLRKST